MKTRKIPMRTCVVTHEKYEKKDLIRVVRTTEGNVQVDTTGKLNGRGAYLKKDADVFKTAKQKKVLDRVLETEVNEKVYEELNKIL